MNDQNSTDLIGEDELRAALRPLRPDADGFAAAVQGKLKSSIVSPVKTTTKDVAASSHVIASWSDWTRIAAAVIPIPMFGKASANAVGSVAKVSFTKKLIALLALPAISLVLMLGGTLWCMLKISRAAKGAKENAMEAKEAWEAVGQWWKRFGWIFALIPFLHVGLAVLGITIPLALVFTVSGLAMVVLMTELGRRGLICRQHLSGGMITGLVTLSGLANIETIGVSSMHLLNQGYVTAVLFAGIILLIAINVGPAAGGIYGGRKTLLMMLGPFIIVSGVLFGLIFRSLWRPVTTESIEQYVADFTEAPFASASWRQWTGVARWLNEKRLKADMAGAQQLAVKEISEGQNILILINALEFHLISGAQAPLVDHYDTHVRQIFDDINRTTPLTSLSPSEYVIRKLLAEGLLTQQQRDVLADRLSATLRAELQSEYVTLENVLSITELAKLIDHAVDRDDFQAPIHDLLLKMQGPDKGAFQANGGFASYLSVGGGDDNATLAAIELMEDWGVPSGINVMALRSYLRPNNYDRSIIPEGGRSPGSVRPGGALHFVSRQRLNDMPDVPAVTSRDYVRYEQNLIMALLLIALATYALWVAPDQLNPRNPQADITSNPETESVTP